MKRIGVVIKEINKKGIYNPIKIRNLWSFFKPAS
jgi:hypothetical protein